MTSASAAIISVAIEAPAARIREFSTGLFLASTLFPVSVLFSSERLLLRSADNGVSPLLNKEMPTLSSSSVVFVVATVDCRDLSRARGS